MARIKVVMRSRLAFAILSTLIGFPAVSSAEPGLGHDVPQRYQNDGPFEEWINKGPISSYPVKWALVSPHGSTTLCVDVDNSAMIYGAAAFVTQLVYNHVRIWKCPSDRDCFGQGNFSNFSRVSPTKICIDYKSDDGTYYQNISWQPVVYVP